MKDELSHSILSSVSMIEGILKEQAVRQIFLVIDREAYRFSGAEDRLKETIEKYDPVIFDQFELNPKIEDVRAGVELLRNSNCDLAIAIGGGSAIDLAKMITSFSVHSVDAESLVMEKNAISKPGIPLIAVPTTAGTGSEATHFAVVYLDQVKYSVAHESILPKYPIVDPELTMSLPASVTMSSGLDALCQGIESCWSVNSNEESREYALKAIELCWEHLESVVNHPSREDRIAMSLASNLAGRAINISKTTAPHAFSYALTTHYRVPHGAAVALTLAEFFQFNSEVTEETSQDSRGANYVSEQISEILKVTNCETVNQFVSQFKSLLKSINAPENLASVGVNTESQLHRLISGMNPERLANNPRKITAKELEQLLRPSIQ